MGMYVSSSILATLKCVKSIFQLDSMRGRVLQNQKAQLIVEQANYSLSPCHIVVFGLLSSASASGCCISFIGIPISPKWVKSTLPVNFILPFSLSSKSNTLYYNRGCLSTLYPDANNTTACLPASSIQGNTWYKGLTKEDRLGELWWGGTREWGTQFRRAQTTTRQWTALQPTGSQTTTRGCQSRVEQQSQGVYHQVLL